ncbi:M48 family metallopeptidase [Kitasatospora aureofaciens]|uniref:M48 family metallopeptidase n=1 Tax=Kitasatospora aureofaciens TaxID=1894 RepID=UPI0033A8E1B2
MSTSGRAVTAVALLAGFYLLALGILAGLLALDVALFQELGHFSPGLVKIWALSAAIGYPVVRVVFLTRRRKDDGEVPGVVLTRERQPAVWAVVDRIAERTGVRGPAEIRLVPQVNAGVFEETRLLGLIPGKRHLVIGAPLLLGLTEGELESVLAHEFGHYSNRDVKLAAVTVAGRRALLHTVGGLHRRADQHQAEEAAKLAAKAEKRLAKGRKPSGEQAGGGVDRALAKLFALYARLYFRVSEAVGRRQEYAADQVAAQLAGRDATASALRKLPSLDAAQDFYLSRYATIGWDAGLLPPPGQVYGGLLHLLSDPERRAELAEHALDLPEEHPDPFDSHPPIRLRVAAIEGLPDDGRGPGAAGPALALLQDAERVLAELEVVTLVPEAARKQRVEWPELVRTAMLSRARDASAPAHRALAGLGLPATVHGLLDAVDAGRAWEFTDRLPKSEQAAAATGRAAREFARPLLREELAHAVVTALAEAGLAAWELSWSGPAELRLPEGFEDGFDAALNAACADTPDTAPLRALLTGAGLPAPVAPAV